MPEIELLSPAKNLEIGIAAINCGADSVYIAAQKYGARQQAGNSFEDIATLCSYAHKYGAKVFLTLNTILYENELSEAQNYMWEAYNCGVDAIIAQDFSLLEMNRPPIPLFASTQTDIRTPEKAQLLEKLGFERLILARELSLEQICEIRKAVSVPLEFFVHGALCVCYSGQCYLSCYLTGRSANRGECAQVCRSEYDLIDENGTTITSKAHLLSLKDLNLSDRISDLIDAGISSFKIEGRLKNISYVKNIVRKYDLAIQEILAKKNLDGKNFRRTAYGKSRCSFVPNADKTFNRGYTEFFLNGKRGDFKSRESAKGMGEYIGTVTDIKGGGNSFVCFTYNPAAPQKEIHNSDGLCFAGHGRITSGNRANSCTANSVELFTKQADFKKGDSIYRNFDSNFEKQINTVPQRLIDVLLDIVLLPNCINITAFAEDFRVTKSFEIKADTARNPQAAKELVKRQFGRISLHFSFAVNNIEADVFYFYKTASLNAIRNKLAIYLQSFLEEDRKKKAETYQTNRSRDGATIPAQQSFAQVCSNSYLSNCSNSLSAAVYKKIGIPNIEPAYEQQPPQNAVLMRCKYCIRYQLAMCPNDGKKLFLVNGTVKLPIEFNCNKCEMSILAQ